jgi:hypothetical protein
MEFLHQKARTRIALSTQAGGLGNFRRSLTLADPPVVTPRAHLVDPTVTRWQHCVTRSATRLPAQRRPARPQSSDDPPPITRHPSPITHHPLRPAAPQPLHHSRLSLRESALLNRARPAAPRLLLMMQHCRPSLREGISWFRPAAAPPATHHPPPITRHPSSLPFPFHKAQRALKPIREPGSQDDPRARNKRQQNVELPPREMARSPALANRNQGDSHQAHAQDRSEDEHEETAHRFSGIATGCPFHRTPSLAHKIGGEAGTGAAIVTVRRRGSPAHGQAPDGELVLRCTGAAQVRDLRGEYGRRDGDLTPVAKSPASERSVKNGVRDRSLTSARNRGSRK